MVYQQVYMQQTARVLDALGDPTRRAVLEALREGARPVGEIAKRVPVSRPAVSQHLRVLKEAGLVRDRRDGTRRLYSVDTTGLAALRAYLERYWDSALAAFKDAAELPSDEPSPPISRRPRKSGKEGATA